MNLRHPLRSLQTGLLEAAAGSMPQGHGQAQRHAEARPRGDGLVVCYAGDTLPAFSHESITHACVAERLAAIKGFEFGGAFDPSARYERPLYLVPSHTLSTRAALQFGLRGEDDLFGGVVAFPFIATKTITHKLLNDESLAPEGWTSSFPNRVEPVVLPGISAFTLRDAIGAGLCMLEQGPARLKLADGIGGTGQWVVRDAGELEARLQLLDADGLLRHGLVIELNLHDVKTLSVGQVKVGGMVASYFGSQHETENNHGHMVYGGSEITVVQGGMDALLELDLEQPVRVAVEQARVYDKAADECFAGSFMSRRNYDIAQGTDGKGTWRSGVLEQSWRVGGASGAELAALEAFKADPSVRMVRASTTELYGDDVVVPDGAIIYFQGIDERVGALTKFSQVEQPGHCAGLPLDPAALASAAALDT